MGCAAVLVGGSSAFIAAGLLKWMGFVPGIGLFALLALGWFQNDLRRVFHATDTLKVTSEWNMLVGHALGLAVVAKLFVI